jgi:hypothetical protein
MTPDELPADMEGRVEAFIEWMDPCNTKVFSGSTLQLVSDLRNLLKAYQERGRALERLANKDNEFGSEVQTIARAALNQKGDER